MGSKAKGRLPVHPISRITGPKNDLCVTIALLSLDTHNRVKTKFYIKEILVYSKNRILTGMLIISKTNSPEEVT